MTKFLVSFGAFLVFALLVSPIVLAVIAYNAWALSLLYEWFLVPAGLPALPYSAFIGIVLFVALCLARYRKVDPEEKEWLPKALFAIFTPLIALGFGQFFLWVM